MRGYVWMKVLRQWWGGFRWRILHWFRREI